MDFMNLDLTELDKDLSEEQQKEQRRKQRICYRCPLHFQPVCTRQGRSGHYRPQGAGLLQRRSI